MEQKTAKRKLGHALTASRAQERNSRRSSDAIEDVTTTIPARAALRRSRVFRIRGRDGASEGMPRPRRAPSRTPTAGPGFFFCTNPFTEDQQRAWCERAAVGFLKPEHQHSLREAGVPASALGSLWQRAVDDGPACDAESTKWPSARGLLDKIRWVTLGFHYDWTRRAYHPEHRTPFPADLGRVAGVIAAELGFCLSPEAGIINFYRPSSSMGGHTDEVELTHEHPVVSISFGCTCVFLLGGTTKDAAPHAMFVRSGDVLIMGGPSRLAVHGACDGVAGRSSPAHACPTGVSKVLAASCPPFLSNPAGLVHRCADQGSPALPFPVVGEAKEDAVGTAKAGEAGAHLTLPAGVDLLWPEPTSVAPELEPVAHTRFLAEFMSRTRINMNVRQVLAAGQSFPCSGSPSFGPTQSTTADLGRGR